MKRSDLITALLLSFVNVLGHTILFPVLPFIIEQYGVPSYFYGLLISSYALFQFFGAPLFGSLSDSYGRKPMMIISHVGTLLSWGVFAIAYSLPNINLWWGTLPIIVIGASRALDGVTAGNNSVVSAYIADTTTREERSKVFGYVGAVTGAGLIIGPAIGGWSAETSYGYLGTIMAATLISIVTLFFIIFTMRETRHGTKKTFKWREVLRKLNVYEGFKSYKDKPTVFTTLQLRLVFFLAMTGYTSIIALYLQDLFGFSQGGLGSFLFVVGAFLIINQMFIVEPVVKRFGEPKTIALGLVLTAIGLVLITLPTKLWSYILLYYPLSLGLGLAFPTIRGFISNNVTDKEQGKVLGLDESLMALSQGVMPVLSAGLYGLIGETVFIILSSFLIFSVIGILWKNKVDIASLLEVES